MAKCDVCGKAMIPCKACETDFCVDCDGGDAKRKICDYCLDDEEDDDDED